MTEFLNKLKKINSKTISLWWHCTPRGSCNLHVFKKEEGGKRAGGKVEGMGS